MQQRRLGAGWRPRAAGRGLPARPAAGQGRLPAPARNAAFLNTLGVAQYRCGLYPGGAGNPDAVERPEPARKNRPTWPSWPWPSTVWVSPMRPATPWLGCAVMKDPQQAGNPESAGLSCARPRRSSSTGSSRPTRSHLIDWRASTFASTVGLRFEDTQRFRRFEATMDGLLGENGCLLSMLASFASVPIHLLGSTGPAPSARN